MTRFDMNGVLRVVKTTTLALCVALAMAGCDKQEQTVAKIDDRVILKSQFDAYLKLKRIPQQNEKAVGQALNEYLEIEVLAEAITKQGYLEDDLVQAEIDEFKKQLLISRYFEKALDEKVSEQALRNFYASHAEDFSSKKMHVAHILIRSNKSASEVERQAQMTKAHEAYSKALSGEDFATVAENYSEDTQSAKSGGDLGWIAETAVDPSFSKAAFALKKDEVSEPIATSFGFHIIKAIEEPKVVQHPFEKVKGDIRYQLRQETKKAETERLRASVELTQP